MSKSVCTSSAACSVGLFLFFLLFFVRAVNLTVDLRMKDNNSLFSWQVFRQQGSSQQRNTSWKTKGTMWNIRSTLCTSLSSSNDAISALLLLIINVSVTCSCSLSFGGRRKELSSIYLCEVADADTPVSVNTLAVRSLQPRAKIEIFCLPLDLLSLCADMTPKAVVSSWCNPQHPQSVSDGLLNRKS